MKESTYKVTKIVGTSRKSGEDAVRNAVEAAGKSLGELRIAEASALDMKIEDNRVIAYRAKGKSLI